MPRPATWPSPSRSPSRPSPSTPWISRSPTTRRPGSPAPPRTDDHKGRNFMTKLGLLIATTLCIAGALGCAKSKEATPAPGPAVGVMQSAGPGEASQAVTATATVDYVDLENRLVTLHTADGEKRTIKVGDEVRNL